MRACTVGLTTCRRRSRFEISTMTSMRHYVDGPPRRDSPFPSCCGGKRRASRRAPRWRSGSPGRVGARRRSIGRRCLRRSTSCGASGLVLVVDASCLYEVVADTERADDVRARLLRDPDHAAPSVVDVEVLSVIRRDHLLGRLDSTAAAQAVEDLRDWPGERFGHQPLLARVWELRSSLRAWDAFYVALGEVLQATLVTSDSRLAQAHGPRCAIDVV